jgi:release factor glutamine methyltransferase
MGPNESMTTIAETIEHAAALLAPSPTAHRDAELLLLHTTRMTKADLLTHPERELTERQSNHYQAAIARRALHEPVQYIIGTQEFYGRPFIVNPLVLIPRPETEHLVEAALALTPRPSRILDIGTGSGILAITLALELPHATITATDISAPALAVAQQNARSLGADHLRFVASNLFAKLDDARFDCIVSNPPYVSSNEELEPQVRDYEPATALYASEDGLAIYRRLIPEASSHLEPAGSLLLEIGQGQRDAIAALLETSGFRNIRFIDDLQGIPRVAIAQKG